MVEWIAEEDPADIEDIRYKHGTTGKEIDIVRKKSLVQVKFWDEETLKRHLYNDELFKEDIKDLKKYETAMREMEKDMVYLVFVKEISRELFDEAARKIMEALGGDASSWLKIINGYMQLER